MMKDILCTLGPASMSAAVISRLEELGATLLRINLSHTKVAQVALLIEQIRSITPLPICLDSEGAQIRTGDIVSGAVQFRENSIVQAHLRTVPGDSLNINFYPVGIIKEFRVGDFISIDFNSVLVQVIEIQAERVTMRVLAGGTVGSNKAVTLERPITMPALTEKDIAAMKIGRDMGIKHFALSFANRGSDVEELRKIVGPDAFIISKIECRNGLANLNDIADRCEALLIDRGDLSREVPLERIPEVQKSIIEMGKNAGKKVYVATNLLESMIKEPTPTRAEINDVYNTLCDGADGLVLAAETAIGAYPVRAASMIVKIIHCFENGMEANDFTQAQSASLLVAPHGGELHQSLAFDGMDTKELVMIEVNTEILLDCEQIAHGTYSPLSGFMGKDALNSVLSDCQLLDGTAWTMPILWQVPKDIAVGLAKGQRVALKSTTGDVHAIVDITDVYTADLSEIAKKWFLTDDKSHPGVARLFSGGENFIGGDVSLVRSLPSPYRHFQLSPTQTRFIFTHKGWSKIVGFHGRNPIHRGHAYIQLKALERSGADGIYLSPIIGPQKVGDFLPTAVLKSYQLMLEFGMYPEGKALLGSFATYPRFCGPREAVFTAICRQNMGCSHFIIGRDHAGVGNFYGPDDNRRMFDQLDGIGITPIFFDAVGYDPSTQQYVEGEHPSALPISGTQIRDAIRDGKRTDDWMIWTMIQDVLIADVLAGEKVFAE